MSEAPPSRRVLEVDGLRTGFETERGLLRAVDGVSFTLDRGRTLGIVGESGSGKSILARSLLGLLPRRGVVSEGRVVLDGRDLSELSRRQRRLVWGREVGIVFQDPMSSLNPVVKIGAQITESLRYHLGMSRRQATRRAADLLGSVGIPEPGRRLGSYPHELSGGMRQRVTIAIAISCEPKLLVADEPTTALDVTVQAQILDLLQEQQRERDMALILVTHDLGVVARRSDEVAVMYAGRFVEHSPTRDLFARMQMPYTEALFRSVPKLTDASHTPLLVIPGRPPDLARLPPGCPFAPRCAYAREKCTEERPPLTPGHHRYACWYPLGAPAVAPAGAGMGEGIG
jgi:oligopeptide/dipeptide ABC transporter ATP-binding protein